MFRSGSHVKMISNKNALISKVNQIVKDYLIISSFKVL